MLKVGIFVFSVVAFSVLIYIVGGIWFRGKRNTYLKLFFTMGLIHSFWVLFNGVNVLLSEELYQQVYPIVMLSGCVLPHIMLRYMLYFTESRFATSRAVVWILTIVPAIDFLALLTNPLHHAFIAGYEGIRPIGGSYFGIHAGLSYLSLLISVVLVFRYVVKNIRKTPSLTYIAVGFFVPLLLNVLYTFNVFGSEFDITPYSFLAMFGFFAFYSIQMRLFNIKETAVTSLFSAMSDAIFVVDSKGIIAEVNPAFLATFPAIAVEPDKTTAGDVAERLKLITTSASSEDLFTLLSEQMSDIHGAEVTVTLDGETRNFTLSKDIIIERGQFGGFIVSLSDVTYLRRLITEMTELKNLAETASVAKSEFLSRMSHEIRTPLNAIIGMSQVALKASDNDKVSASINEILLASGHLLTLLNDVLDMAKIESGKFEISSEPFALRSAVEETASIISQRCKDKNISFVADYGGANEITVLGDKLRLKQVLLNLLGNAVKFTPEGGRVGLMMSVTRETDRQFDAQFIVTDNGVGMTSEQMSKLFIPFEQTGNMISSQFGGTGLGLSISQNLAERMGGHISAESSPGAGSVFTFAVSLLKSLEAQPQDDTVTMPDLAGKRLLLVEDVAVNRLILTELLGETNIDIDEAEDGARAVELFGASPEGHYDIVFMDIRMPNMDGYEATEAIRAAQRGDAKDVPIIALTAHAYHEDVMRALAVGMNGHLSKPVDIRAVINVLKEWLQ